MRYTNHSSVALYANANNLNGDMSPSSKGEWKKTDPSVGEKTTYMAGLDFSLEPKDSKLSMNTSLQAQRQERLNLREESAENYYTQGNTFENTSERNNTTSNELRWKGKLSLSGNPFGTLTTSAYYQHNKERGISESERLQAVAANAIDSLYSRTTENQQRVTRWGTDVSVSGYWLPVRSLSVDWGTELNYNKEKNDGTSGDRIVYQAHSANNVFERRMLSCPTHDYAYYFTTHLERTRINLSKKLSCNVNLKYKYTQKYNSGRQDLQRSEGDCSLVVPPPKLVATCHGESKEK